MKNRQIYLLLTRFPDNGSKVFELLTGCYYPHASIGLEEDLNTFYSFVSKGFIVEKITRYVKPDRAPFPCQLYELEVSESAYSRIKKALEHFIAFKEQLHYSKFALTMSILRIPYKRNRFGFFCSQFVAHILQHSGEIKLKKSSSRYLSGDLRKLSGIKLQFQGNMKTMIDYFGISPSAA